MKSFMTPYADQNITQELANRRLPLDKVVVGWYSNREVHKSVTHSHPYHEYIYMIGGKALKYSRPKNTKDDDNFIVAAQYPKAGTKVKRNSVVYIYKE